jgi:hypothetical protein
MFINYRFQVTNTTAPTSFTLLIPASKSIAHGFETVTTCLTFSSTTPNVGYASLNNGTPTLVNITPTGLVNGEATVVTGMLTFEIA